MGEYLARDTGEIERVRHLDRIISKSPLDSLKSEALLSRLPEGELERRLPPEKLLRMNSGRNLTLVLEKSDLYGSWAGYIHSLVNELGYDEEEVSEARIVDLIKGEEIDRHINRIYKHFEDREMCTAQTMEIYEKVIAIRKLMRYEKYTGICLADHARKIDSERRTSSNGPAT